ncbi:hypothetical protein FBY31_0600 [Arthrobacter sp. SLBN-100]|nr:hypothetical protein FBY31_0600 [Arthrobacter sp. SLBN-100]
MIRDGNHTLDFCQAGRFAAARRRLRGRRNQPGPPDVLIQDDVMALEIEGPSGTISATTDRLRLNGMNTRSDFSEVTYFLTASSLGDFKDLIRDGVDRYGIPGESAEGWIESISSRPEEKSDFALQAGTSTGLRVTYDLRYDGSKNVQVIIVHVSPLSSDS